MLFDSLSLSQSPLRQKITQAYYLNENEAVDRLIDFARFDQQSSHQAGETARRLIEAVRKDGSNRSGIEAFMYHYDLSCEEGILLMCLAEALLRIPDKETENLLIEDKLTSANWEAHLGSSESGFVNAATWGLSMTGKLLNNKQRGGKYMQSIWRRMLKRSGEPVIRRAVREVMKVLTQQFVVGRTIEEALSRSKKQVKQGYSYSYDMLGEAARTQADADEYFKSYQHAIEVVGRKTQQHDIFQAPGISVKLSALHPRYEFANQESVVPYMVERLKQLALLAKQHHVSLTVDAEEAYRLDISLDIIERVFADPDLKDWQGLGLAIQAYQKRCFYLIDWLVDMAKRHNKTLQVRLVKGAYWDTEVKFSQVEGYQDYPVFTRKMGTDVSYIACAKKLLAANDVIYPQFATHNAYSVAAILTLMGDDVHRYRFEFQNLQGMGKALHDTIVAKQKLNLHSRIYAPVGVHEDLLPYLVRRLLENGANSSFVNKVVDDETSIDDLIENPIDKLASYSDKKNTQIPLPADLYGKVRKNSAGIDLTDIPELSALHKGLTDAGKNSYVYGCEHDKNALIPVYSPADKRCLVGEVHYVSQADVSQAIEQASSAFASWTRGDLKQRADILNAIADLLEQHSDELMFLAIREAGKTVPDAIAEIREAVDFCRYYAAQGKKVLKVKNMPGPTGETNQLMMQGRGVVCCISPWNFPIAIFTGQVTAALMAGNCVLAKPAEQTSLVAMRVVELMHEAGVPKEVLHCLPGRGEDVGARLVDDERVAAVIFTGSTQTAKGIQKALANRQGAIVPLIAETGGINAMIADSSALHEQLVDDVISSAFGSAGQRCSALRVLFVQEEAADDVITMLKGAMATLKVGDPALLNTDVGPVIDQDALDMLQSHAQRMDQKAELLHRVEVPAHLDGNFFAPCAYLLKDASQLDREVFGPVLHVVRYKQSELDKTIDAINHFGYGLTFGVHSRISDVVDYITDRIEVGNVYVNRNMIGAVVGVQPFGGCHLSGTGPKAGGPHYLLRLCDEKTITINTTAAGGNASLMSLGDE
ncbi:MAG: bifunctional proline dehydrogenase/L-glutamate gamma-semialdehyde dehydrogenase PutA [Coxiellaceae bacterium]|nr:bifunctional proline dehydrogenase/L-glutamate gamma-semialdehyde dehydrogenase PutA [Coxiellaceae bacterium]